MKSFGEFILLLLLLCSCSGCGSKPDQGSTSASIEPKRNYRLNGLDRPIVETLSVDELRANINNDTCFSDFYEEAQKLRAWVLYSDMNEAKWGDITYGDLLKYRDESTDSVFVGKLSKALKDEYDSLYPIDYSQQVDSIMNYWREYNEQSKPESYVKVEFEKLWKEHFYYSNEVSSVNVGFKVTSLKGKIEQLVFRYDIKSKISNDKTIGSFSGKSCLASSPIDSPKVLYWEADYSHVGFLKNSSDAEVRRDYDFIIEIVDVRVDGSNVSEKKDSIPHSVSMALEYCPTGNNHYADDIIKELVDGDYKSFNDYASPKYNAALKELNPKVYELLEEVSKEK